MLFKTDYVINFKYQTNIINLDKMVVVKVVSQFEHLFTINFKLKTQHSLKP